MSARVLATAAAGHGQPVSIYLFDERPETYMVRAEGIGIPLRQHVAEGRVVLRQLDPAEIAPGEFAQRVAASLAQHGDQVVVDHFLRDQQPFPGFIQNEYPDLLDFYDPVRKNSGPVLIFIGDSKPDNATADVKDAWLNS